jgi:hypothetical protein
VAQYVGGATIQAELSNHLPGIGEEVVLNATLNVGDEPVAVESANVVLHHPDGSLETISVSESGDGIVATWQPAEPGVYGIDINVRSELPDGSMAERSTFLALEAFEEAPEIRQ